MSPLADRPVAARPAAVRGRGGRHRGQLRILPAQDGEDGSDALGVGQDAGAARAALRLGDLRRRRLDPRAHPRHGRADRSARPALHAAAHLTCVEASRDEIDEVARAYWEAGVRHIVALRGDPPEPGKPLRAASGRLCQCRRAGRGPEAGRAVRDFGRRLSRMPSGFGRPRPPISTISSARSTPAPTGRSRQFFFSPDCFLRFRDEVAAAGIDAEIVPGILPVSNVAQTRKFAAMCGAAIPPWMDRLFEGLDDLPAARQLVAATVAAELCAPALCGRGPPIPFLHAEPGRAQLRDLPSARPQAQGTAPVNTAEQLKAAAAERILIKDGAYGTADPGAPAAARPIIAARSTSAATRRAITTS